MHALALMSMLLVCSTLQPLALRRPPDSAASSPPPHARRQAHSIAPYTVVHSSLLLLCVTDASNRGGGGNAGSIIGSVLIAGACLWGGALWDPPRCGARSFRHQQGALPPYYAWVFPYYNPSLTAGLALPPHTSFLLLLVSSALAVRKVADLISRFRRHRGVWLSVAHRALTLMPQSACMGT